MKVELFANKSISWNGTIEKRAQGAKSTEPKNRMTFQKPVAKMIFVTVLSLAAMSVGCKAGYIFHAAVGQFRMVGGSVPIEEALDREEISEERAEKLKWIPRIKDFGENELGLKPTENYESVYMENHRPPLYVVSACPKDRLSLVTWWFPVVGDVPYLAFFDLKRAREEQKRLEAKNLDVTLGAADAYSTLGWFKDPVTLNLLELSLVDLVDTILHELTHTTLYVDGQGEFNEGLAVLVGKVGALRFMERQFGSSHALTREAGGALYDERLFAETVDAVLTDLEDLYGSSRGFEEKLEMREKIFRRAAERFSALGMRLKTDRFKGFASMPFNNASLLATGLYHRHFRLFEQVLKEEDNSIPQTISYFQDLYREKGDLIKMMQRRIHGIEIGAAREAVLLPAEGRQEKGSFRPGLPK